MTVVAVLPADAVISAYLAPSCVTSALFALAGGVESIRRAPASHTAFRALVTDVFVFASRPQVSSSAFRDVTPHVTWFFVRRARAAPALDPGPIVAATTLLSTAVVSILIVLSATGFCAAVIARIWPARSYGVVALAWVYILTAA